MTKINVVYRKLPTGIKTIPYDKDGEKTPIDEEKTDNATDPNYIDGNYNLYKQKNSYIQYDTNKDDEDLSDCR